MRVMHDEVIHEELRVFGNGKGKWRIIAELCGYFAVAGLIVPSLRDVSYVEALVITVIMIVAFSGFVLLVSRARVTVTRTEVRARGALRTTVIRRDRIAEAVHVKQLHVMGIPQGYLALLDDAGEPLWRTTTEKWTPRTLKVLTASGRRRTVLDEAGPAEIVGRWPRLLPWQLAHPMAAFWGTVVGLLAVVGVVLGVTFVLWG